MTNLTLQLENEIKAFTVQMKNIWLEAEDLYKMYWAAGPSSELSALGGGDAATVSTKLTKNEVIRGVTLCEELKDFFGNDSVATSDYMSSIQNIYYGNNAAVSPVSVAVEALGSRLYSLCGTCWTQFNKAKALLDLYNDTEIAAAVGAISTTTVVFGANVNKSLLLSGMVLIEQFKKMINNEAVTTGDYAATIAKWEQVA
jgi:hypothetical protein